MACEFLLFIIEHLTSLISLFHKDLLKPLEKSVASNRRLCIHHSWQSHPSARVWSPPGIYTVTCTQVEHCTISQAHLPNNSKLFFPLQEEGLGEFCQLHVLSCLECCWGWGGAEPSHMCAVILGTLIDSWLPVSFIFLPTQPRAAACPWIL